MVGIPKDEFNGLYSEITEIGSGGGGVIYKAYHQRLQKYVVLKKMHAWANGILEERMETDILKNLHHEYLPQVIDFLKIKNDVYTVMDFIEGKSFDQLIKEKTVFKKEQVLKYTRQLCEVMAYLHKQKPPVLHGDIKPANIILRPDDSICLIDFNIAGFLTEGAMSTVGYSAGYASPEQCQAVRFSAGIKSDIWKSVNYGDTATELLESGGETDDKATELINSGNKTDDEATLMIGGGETDDEATLMISGGETDDEATELLEHLDLSNKKSVSAKARESVTIDNSAIKIDLRADVYSIGATVYHLATGIRPSSQPEKNTPIENAAPQYSNGFSVIINKAMEADAGKRFANAEEMLRAVKWVHKYDRKYKAMLIKQELVYFVLMLFIGASVFMYFSGDQKMKQERLEKYEAMIEKLIAARESNSDDFEELYEEASSYMPEKLDANYQKAVYLAEQGMYEEDTDFIQDALLNETDFLGQEFADDTYYLLANCFFELEQYKDAVVYYQAAVGLNSQVSQYYGDYAISLVYCGKIDNAEEVLRQGRERGMDSDYVLLVSAEIESAKEKYDEAVTHFNECIETTDNAEMKLRAYVLCDKTLRKMGNTEEILLESEELLMRARTDIEEANQILILERLAQDYIDLAAVTGNDMYDETALSVFDEIIAHGWGNATTQMNKAVLLEKLNRLSEAKEILEELAESDESNYVYYKRLAVLEADIQGTKANEERDYKQFIEYYDMTMDLCEKAKQSANDAELQWLQQMYQQLITGGWIDG